MSDRLYVATRKGLFTVERGADGRWKITRTAFLADPVSIVLPESDGRPALAALDHGHFGCKLHRSLDGGATWEEAACPEYPPKPDDEEDINPMQQRPTPWKLSLIWSLAWGHSDESSVLWCGTIPGGVFRSPDGGTSWEFVRSLWDDPLRKQWFGGGADYPGIHSICVDPRDTRRVIVGVSCGGVWVTPDSGATWKCQADGMFAEYMPPDQQYNPAIQDPHRVVQCPAAPDVLWAQHHNGVFRTTDGCQSWQVVNDVPPSGFGFAVAVHPRDPDTAWLVPAQKDEHRIPVDGRVVVTRTRDGGRTFDVLREGLPQEHAYDLTFRHALDIDESGDRLAFGSTTGSLWISENQGDHWQCISQHLPPIYCVAFAK